MKHIGALLFCAGIAAATPHGYPEFDRRIELGEAIRWDDERYRDNARHWEEIRERWRPEPPRNPIADDCDQPTETPEPRGLAGLGVALIAGVVAKRGRAK